jgi:hypothetical protein
MKELAKGLISFGQLFDFLHFLNNYGYIQILIFLVFMINCSMYV